jgi:hypothetical protein
MKALVGTNPKELTSTMTRKRREKARVLSHSQVFVWRGIGWLSAIHEDGKKEKGMYEQLSIHGFHVHCKEMHIQQFSYIYVLPVHKTKRVRVAEIGL